MLAKTETVEPPALSQAQHKANFFRQSGWMVIAAVAGGAFMYLVHTIAKGMPKDDYGLFTTLLQIVTMIGIPAGGLQPVIAQQAAAALTESAERQLASVVRGVLRATFLIWLLMAALVFIFRAQVLSSLQTTSAAAIWITVLVGLAALWFPIINGLLQGRQNFLWLGWVSILNGIGRFSAIAITVGLLGGWAAGGMVAVFIGMAGATIAGGWQLRDFLRAKAEHFAWRDWLARVIPLTLGLGASQVLMAADMMFVRHFFTKEQTGYYAAAGMIGRALVLFTAPLTSVMFPKLARSAALSEKTDVLKHTLCITIFLSGSAAIGCSIMPSLPLRMIYDQSYLPVATPLVPWFVWCMVPLTLANVLISSLMARARFAAVPWLGAVALGYVVALYYFHDTFKMVIQTLGIFGVLMVAVCAYFTWGVGDRKPVAGKP